VVGFQKEAVHHTFVVPPGGLDRGIGTIPNDIVDPTLRE
jgi:hypothetical protein